MKQIQQKCQTDEYFANDITKDNNKFGRILFIQFTLEAFELVVLILNTSYILGLLWYTMCEVVEDLWLSTDFKDENGI